MNTQSLATSAKAFTLAAIVFLSACTTPAPVQEPETPGSRAPVDTGKPKEELPKNSASTETSWKENYSALLKKYVTSNGVRYSAWKGNAGDLAKLKTVVDAISSTKATGSEKEKLAYYLNAYNAWILNNVLADYPVKGVGGGHALGRNAFFGGERITVGGTKTSFNDLEHETIRKQFSEPRVHFALNCASAGCPPLMDRPFRSATLDADLTRLTRAFVNGNPEGVRKTTDGAYSLSEIFTWFKEDFGDVVAFINGYRAEPIPADAKTESHDYDWSLNDAS